MRCAVIFVAGAAVTALAPPPRSFVRRRVVVCSSSSSSSSSSNKEGEVEWIPFGLLMSAQLVLYTGVGAVIPAIPLYASAIGLSSASSGVVIAAPAAAMVAVSRVAGRAADAGRKRPMMWGMGLIAVADYGTAVAGDFATLGASRVLLGIGRSVSEAGERGMLADMANRVPALRGRALAAQQTIAALGIAIGARVGGVVTEEFGIRANFLCVSVAALCALALYAPLPETAPKVVATINSDDRVWPRLLGDDRWRALCACECGVRFGFAAKIASVPLLAARLYDGSPAAAGLVLSIAAISGLVAAPVGGLLIDRAGARATALGSGLVAGLALVLVPTACGAGGSDAFTALVALWSAAVAVQGPALTAIAQLLAGADDDVATTLALPRAFADATYVVAPFLLGLIADAYAKEVPGLDCAFAGLATLLGASALLVLGDSLSRANGLARPPPSRDNDAAASSRRR
ncbi:hypothetical protein CTAYLR_006674 [Chrysophaeum taylorii]|uniref:Major facilitator superfamily (MFS) profile domain-containing protein n=1 Tax=Chrysophaeum taylorii TaxID=2483200 RepID=A0AAD7UG43_9STRA|nr:hypothetical protein CTAYLR_006674 [Chrysophaeum taylorii]